MMDNSKSRPDDTASGHRNQNDPDDGDETPGDTDAPDIVGRTGEEMPAALHDDVDDEPRGGNLTD